MNAVEGAVMWTVPNLVTLTRLAALPAVLWLAHAGRHGWAALLFLGLMGLDSVDGWLARRLDQGSVFGLYIDPVADKVMILVMLYDLAFRGWLPGAIPHLLLARELLQNGVRSAAAAQGAVVGANWMGKTKAVLQTALVTWGLCLPMWAPAPDLQAWFTGFGWLVLGVAWLFSAVFLWWNRETVWGAAG